MFYIDILRSYSNDEGKGKDYHAAHAEYELNAEAFVKLRHYDVLFSLLLVFAIFKWTGVYEKFKLCIIIQSY